MIAHCTDCGIEVEVANADDACDDARGPFYCTPHFEIEKARREGREAIALVYDEPNGDWVALYRGGKLVYQGHSIEETQLLRLLGIEHVALYTGDTEKTDNRFPDQLTDVRYTGSAEA